LTKKYIPHIITLVAGRLLLVASS